MANIDSFEVGYPVNFYSGGDTTKEAFHKHIQEIEKIYGDLNAINADKVSASEVIEKINSITGQVSQGGKDLKSHIDSSNPHPNYKPSFSDISGTLDGSRIKGQLPIQVIEEGTVYTDDPDKTTIIIPNAIKGETFYEKGTGYIILKDTIIQWGSGWGQFTTAKPKEKFYINFPISFPKRTQVVLVCCCTQEIDRIPDTIGASVVGYNQQGFYYMYNKYDNVSNPYLTIKFIAIGY